MSSSYRWPVVTGIIGIGLCAVASSIFIQGFGAWSTSFQGPGSVSIEIPAAGDYRLWHEYSTIVNGRLQVVDEQLPSGSVVAILDANGTALPSRQVAGSHLDVKSEQNVP